MPFLGQKSIKFFISKYLLHFNFLKWSKVTFVPKGAQKSPKRTENCFNKTAPLALHMPEAKMCCCNNSQTRLCKSSWWQPAESRQSQYWFPFFIGWVLLLRGCSEVCRAHLTAVRQSCSLAILIWERNKIHPCFPGTAGGFLTPVWDVGVSSAIISTWQLHVTSIAGDEVQHSPWEGLSGQLVTESWSHISSSGDQILQFSIFYRKENAGGKKKKRSQEVQLT